MVLCAMTEQCMSRHILPFKAAATDVVCVQIYGSRLPTVFDRFIHASVNRAILTKKEGERKIMRLSEARFMYHHGVTIS